MTSTATPSLAQSWVNPLPARLHKPAFGVFVLWVAADSVRLWLGEAWPEGWAFLGLGVWVAAALTLTIGLARRLPAQNVFAVAVLAGLFGFAIEALNVATQIPFGHRAYQGALGSRALGVAWYLPFVWVALAISGRGVARLILRPWRKLQYYGLWVMAAAIILTLLMALNYEAAGSRLDWWWRENRAGVWSWYGSPAVSLLGWGITTLLIYGFTTPWFLNKQPVKQPTDWHPLIVWEILLLWLILISGLQGAWSAVAVGTVSGLLAAGLAIRGGTW